MLFGIINLVFIINFFYANVPMVFIFFYLLFFFTDFYLFIIYFAVGWLGRGFGYRFGVLGKGGRKGEEGEGKEGLYHSCICHFH